MTRAPFYSDTEFGPPERTVEAIDDATWRALRVVIERHIAQQYFAKAFPVHCYDSDTEVVGTDVDALIAGVEGLVPTLRWKPEQTGYGDPTIYVPSTGYALDTVQFFYRYAAKPSEGYWHSFMKHHHLSFDQPVGQDEFRVDVNEVFERRGIAYELQVNGSISRLGVPVIREALTNAQYNSGDQKLDGLMDTARVKYFDPNPVKRKEGLDALWDAFERVKTLSPGDKKVSVASLLKAAFPEPTMRERVGKEMKELTDIGNTFDIRHHETRVTPISDPDDVEYLFGRMYTLMHGLLAKTGRLAKAAPVVPDDDIPF